MALCPAKCGDTIYFFRNDKTDKPAPVETVAVKDGNVTLDFEHGTYHVLTKDEIAAIENPGMFDEPAPQRFVLHFVNCRNAERFRSCRKCHHTPCTCEKPDAQ